MQPQFKACPKCRQPAMLNALLCTGCGHKYSSQFNTGSPDAPPAPAAAAVKQKNHPCCVALVFTIMIAGWFSIGNHKSFDHNTVSFTVPALLQLTRSQAYAQGEPHSVNPGFHMVGVKTRSSSGYDLCTLLYDDSSQPGYPIAVSIALNPPAGNANEALARVGLSSVCVHAPINSDPLTGELAWYNCPLAGHYLAIVKWRYMEDGPADRIDLKLTRMPEGLPMNTMGIY